MVRLKEASRWLVRLVLVCIAMAMAYSLSTVVVGQTATTMTPEEASWAGQALFLVSAINALVLSYPILHSRWHGLALVITVILVQFGVETFLSQIETLYFNRALNLDMAELVGIVAAGALRALAFGPLAVLILGRMKRPVQLEEHKAAVKLPESGVRLAALAVLYVVVYFVFGYFVAWQWPETRQFYSGTTAIKPFFAHFRDLFRADPSIVAFQLLRGALWTALAMLIVRMMKAKQWEASLAVALTFAGLLCSGLGLFPNPYMPSPVRQSHFFELLSSMLLFGGIAGWVTHSEGRSPLGGVR